MQHRIFRSIALAAATAALAAAFGGNAGAATDNRALANRLVATFIEAQNTMNVALFDKVFPEDYIQHNPSVPSGLAGVKKAFADEFAAIAAKHLAVHTAIEDVVVDGDRVVLRELVTFTKDGKTYQARSIDEWRIVNGLLGEHWDSDTDPQPVASLTP